MPIYEEKLVSPFAIRFTQDHIRTTFRDGRVVEDAVDQIGTKSGIGGYDAILAAPFPPIEILRWCMPRQDADLNAETSCRDVGVRPREHWFTLDNRRLYCLQRAAVAQWPARVAAVVAILYADPGTVRKKFDSTSFGCSVSIGHSYDDIPIMRWDWREKVLPLEVSAVTENYGVLATVIADDRKRTVDALLDASRSNPLVGGTSHASASISASAGVTATTTAGGSVSSTASPQATGTAPANSNGGKACATPSTVDGGGSEASETGSAAGGGGLGGGGATSGGGGTGGCSSGAAMTPSPPPPAAPLEEQEVVRPVLDAYDPVVANAIREIKEQINSRGSDGRVSLPHWDDRYGELLGPLRAFIESRPDKFAVIPGEGDEYTVVKARKRDRGERAAKEDRGHGSLAKEALAEIEEQLNVPRHDGRVSIPHWKERYEAELGSLRTFCKSFPDKFSVIAGDGRHFRVVKSENGTAMRALREVEEQLDHPDCDGKLLIPRWNERYGKELGTFEDFLKSRPDKFTIVPGAGASFTVVKTRDALAQKALAELDRQLDDPDFQGHVWIPDWNVVYEPILGPLRGFLESRPDKFTVTFADDRSFTVEKCDDDLAERAVREIEEQLNDPKHEGRLRVSRWNERYKDVLGSLKGFLERYPEKFKVRPSEGSKFAVTKRSDELALEAVRRVEALLDVPGFDGCLQVPEWEQHFGPRLGVIGPFLEKFAEKFAVEPGSGSTAGGAVTVRRAAVGLEWEAVAQIEAQLEIPGNSGHLRIPHWNERFAPTLGSFRRFVEGMPGRFTVIPEQGNKFSVAKVNDEIVQSAILEVEAQFRSPDYDGFLQIPSWSERYSPFLGTLRQFIKSRPNLYNVTNFGNVMYTFPARAPAKLGEASVPGRPAPEQDKSACAAGADRWM